MKFITNHYLENQIRESATLELNGTQSNQDEELFFVQFDDYHAVGSDGSIYQIVEETDLGNPVLYYKAASGNVYNYAEDSAEFEKEEDQNIFNHCLQQAEMNKYGADI